MRGAPAVEPASARRTAGAARPCPAAPAVAGGADHQVVEPVVVEVRGEQEVAVAPGARLEPRARPAELLARGRRAGRRPRRRARTRGPCPACRSPGRRARRGRSRRSPARSRTRRRSARGPGTPARVSVMTAHWRLAAAAAVDEHDAAAHRRPARRAAQQRERELLAPVAVEVVGRRRPRRARAAARPAAGCAPPAPGRAGPWPRRPRRAARPCSPRSRPAGAGGAAARDAAAARSASAWRAAASRARARSERVSSVVVAGGSSSRAGAVERDRRGAPPVRPELRDRALLQRVPGLGGRLRAVGRRASPAASPPSGRGRGAAFRSGGGGVWTWE